MRATKTAGGAGSRALAPRAERAARRAPSAAAAAAEATSAGEVELAAVAASQKRATALSLTKKRAALLRSGGGMRMKEAWSSSSGMAFERVFQSFFSVFSFFGFLKR